MPVQSTAPRRPRFARLAGVIAALSFPAVLAAEPPAVPPAAVEVPFDFSQGVVILEVDFGGSRPAKMMLDTGDADSLLDLASARALGLPLDMQNLKAAGSGERAVTFFQTTQPKVRLGAAEFADQPFVIMPDASKNLLGDTGVRCEGTLGYDFFKGRVVQIDYPARRLRLLAAAPAPPSAAGADVALQWRRYDGGTPPLVTTDALRIGDRAVCAQIDTCFAQGLLLFTTKLPELATRPAVGTAAARYEDAALTAVTLPAPVALGGHVFKTNPVVHLAGGDARIPETEIVAVLGNGFFQEGVLTLDFPAGRITAEWK